MEEITASFLEIIEKGEKWENEYGYCNTSRTLPLKSTYYTRTDFKVQCKPKSNHTTLFKIVPAYFSFPGGPYYWHYPDGTLENGKIIFY